MGREIERKFLVTGDAWRGRVSRTLRIRQGYLFADGSRSARIRLVLEADRARGTVTVKGAREGIARLEYEYPIPPTDAAEMLDRLCLPSLIEKVRYEVIEDGLTWEVDAFEGDNAGLILAEVELERPDQHISPPAWVGEDVTDDARYYNSVLAQTPFRTWSGPGGGR